MKIFVSIGDINGIGLEIALKAHDLIKKSCEIIYCVDVEVLNQASEILKIKIPSDFNAVGLKDSCSSEVQDSINSLISPAKIDKLAGEYSFRSFESAFNLANSESSALLTLPIHKKSWQLANINFVGHTDFLSQKFGKKGIMMLGCQKLFVALFTDHIPLKNVGAEIRFDKLTSFFRNLNKCHKFDKALVLGLNPHAGDNGVLGNEESIINSALDSINKELNAQKFIGAISPDIAFAPHLREQYKMFVAMYHDQGLAPLKALYFDESINVTLGLPILRASVDHGVAFDIAYKNRAKIKSYLNAVKFIMESANG